MAKRTTKYYDESADRYDRLHGGDQNLEHVRALEKSWPLLECLVDSVLDVGCGTARSLHWFAQRKPSLALNGVDPSSELLKIAKERSPNARLEVGQGEALAFEDSSIDLVLATGIMHHVDHPDRVIREIFRVARKAVLISDHNNFAFGSKKARRLRLWLYATGLLGVATFVKQGFKRQGYSEGDGWWYPYSLLNDYAAIAGGFEDVYLLPTRLADMPQGNLLLTQSHVAILVIKSRS
jgi:ubiquinone/menaquinone biosynthesis C-methylase UbiE